MGFDGLPDELIVKILSNLTTKDILVNVARVSKRLHRLSLDPDAHVAVQLPDLKSTSSLPVLDFLKGKTKIRTVRIEGSDCPALSRSVLKLAVLKQVTLEGLELAAWEDLTASEVRSIIALPKLRRLKMSNVAQRLLKAIISSVNPQKTQNVVVEGEFRSVFHWTGQMPFQMTLRNSCLVLEDRTYTFTADGVGEMLSAGLKNKGLRKVDVRVHEPGNNTHEFLLEKGGHFFIRTNSGFMEDEELAEVMESLSTIAPPLKTAKIEYNTPLPIDLVRAWKRKIPGHPTVTAKMSL